MAAASEHPKHPDLPGFTAVNGKDQSQNAPVASMSVNGPARRGSDERPNGQPRISPPGHEKLTITTSREEWPAGERASARPSYPPSGSYENDTSHKRKRSGSVDQQPAVMNYHAHTMPSTKATPTTASTEPDSSREDAMRPPPPHPDPRDSYSAQTPYADSAGGDSWYRRSENPQQQMQMADEQHLGEVIQRETQRLDTQNEYGHGTPVDDNKSAMQYGQQYLRDGDSPQSDLKKRKRNFSNRTKTGCMTCRRRKKKCDENKPECNNCLRGGFVCSGYQVRGQWPKTEQKQAPVPLQSKNDYESPLSAYSQHSPFSNQAPAPPRRDLPAYRGQQLRVDPQHGRTMGPEDNQPSATISSASTTSPEHNRLSAISYQGQTATPISASTSAYPDRLPKTDFPRAGPLHDHTRQDPKPQELATPQSANPTIPTLLHPPTSAPSPRTSLQMVAQSAQLAISNPNANRTVTAKENMLAGRYYHPFDKELVLERERCNGACWRFNSSTNPNNGVSPEERSRLFRDILQPREHVISPSLASPLSPVGRVGEDVTVEAPFNCDYGYNITIGKEVHIGKNCTILDTCEVTIGDRCVIGPNVNIYAATLPVDPKRRLGSKGPHLGNKIIIENDCWIGGGVTILAGRTIGYNSTVGAGSVVTRDVPPNVLACGNPARVIRGLGYV
ncbi:hypothetical protein BP6252_12325 [Coleophoma cylindrospora]|uniref:Zn(2)-C6 fungal-type domain-containing protein n=1 Tax=Coleophoma cylindrospora TaxID=1849047 RepID=A0A3D8QGJ3_9HELO|nr:hypothetical protein BP6252_12325 [Coleophoma cylindrospora]